MRNVRSLLANAVGRQRIAALSLGALLGVGAMIHPASSMPANGLAAAVNTPAPNGVQKIGWVCGPYRCWWRPFTGGPFWAPYRYWGPGYAGYYCNPYYNPYCTYGYRW